MPERGGLMNQTFTPVFHWDGQSRSVSTPLFPPPAPMKKWSKGLVHETRREAIIARSVTS